MTGPGTANIKQTEQKVPKKTNSSDHPEGGDYAQRKRGDRSSYLHRKRQQSSELSFRRRAVLLLISHFVLLATLWSMMIVPTWSQGLSGMPRRVYIAAAFVSVDVSILLAFFFFPTTAYRAYKECVPGRAFCIIICVCLPVALIAMTIFAAPATMVCVSVMRIVPSLPANKLLVFLIAFIVEWSLPFIFAAAISDDHFNALWDTVGLPCGKEWRRWRSLNNEAGIAWVRVGAVRRWARNGHKLPRRQQLRREEYVVGSAGYFYRRRFVVSHAWLAGHHPDPDGSQLHQLVFELDELGARDADLIFYDFCSLPQIDKTQYPWIQRSPDEDKKFFRALQGMHHLYTYPHTEVVVLPHVPSTARNPCLYIERGWCFFEFCISSAYRTIANDENSSVHQILDDIGAPLEPNDFRTEFRQKVFTCRGDADYVKNMYEQLMNLEPLHLILSIEVMHYTSGDSGAFWGRSWSDDVEVTGECFWYSVCTCIIAILAMAVL